MKTRTFATLAGGLFGLLAGTAAAAVVTVTNLTPGPALDRWSTVNIAVPASGSITGTNPRAGNGSVELASGGDTGKFDVEYLWGYRTGRTLGKLDALDFEWFRSSSSTTTQPVAPAFRLIYDADGNPLTQRDFGLLIWERVYNGGAPIPTNAWQSGELLAGNFWQRKGGTVNIEQYDVTLAEWAAGTEVIDPRGNVAEVLGSDTAILGMNFGIGSGWAGSFLGFVDTVTIGFGGDSTTYNFELQRGPAIPEPSSLGLLGVGLLGAALLRRRRSA